MAQPLWRIWRRVTERRARVPSGPAVLLGIHPEDTPPTVWEQTRAQGYSLHLVCSCKILEITVIPEQRKGIE